MYRLLFLLPLMLLATSAAAWQVDLNPDNGEIRIANHQTLSGVDAYLVQADLDLPPDRWRSWSLEGHWRQGVLPVLSRPMNLAPFEARDIGAPPSECDDDRRCILAMVAVADGDSPLDGERWLAASIQPLTAAAARLRLPGQRLFLPTDGDTPYSPEPPLPTPNGATTQSEDSANTANTATTTEKPDIFRLEGNRLLYANGPAERFQVIDVSDPAAPRLEAWQALRGAPKEIYALNGYYVLMQGNQWADDDGTRVTTLRLTDDGGLETVDERTLSGGFVESRRRNGTIYAVTQQYGYQDGTIAVNIHALTVDTAGGIGQSAEASFSGYQPEVAIFSDHLAVTGHDTESWRATNVQLYDLSRAETPLHPLPLLQVPGRIPSEFHLDVSNGLLRLVHGPLNWEEGSTLAIYTLGDDALTLAGSAGPIAPGEQLFATRFVDDTAYVVTYERTDPLWVVDLTNPSAPAIAGQLEVPGWSELLFFNDQRLFAVGIDDQPTADEEWARRVAVSLFDVADPTNPLLLSRLTPLAGEARYSHSPALDDERALLLDWSDGYAALPITSWDVTTQNRLQLVTIGPDSLTDGGYLDSATTIQRSVELDIDTLVALGDQALTTLSRGNGTPRRLAELELARNLTWIAADDDRAWVAGGGDGGYHRLYRFSVDQLETPTDQRTLASAFSQAITNRGELLFYNQSPLTVQYFSDGQAGPLLELEDETTSESYWWQRSLLLAGGRIYLSETRATIRELPFHDLMPPAPEESALSTLRSWRIADGIAEAEGTLSIPGQAVAVNDEGELLTLERDADGAYLHHLVLESDAARLLTSHALPCQWPTTLWRPPALYVSCAGDYSVDGGNTTLIRYGAANGFAEEGRWRLEGSGIYLVAADATRVMVNQYDYSILPEPAPLTATTTADTSIFAPTESRCRILDLSGSEPVELATPESCSAYAAAITGDRLLQARGYAGIRETRW